MMLGSLKNSRPVLVFLVLMIASLVGLLLLPPIAQDQSYHDFADQRTFSEFRISGTLFRIFPLLRSEPQGCGNFAAIPQSMCFSWEYF